MFYSNRDKAFLLCYALKRHNTHIRFIRLYAHSTENLIKGPDFKLLLLFSRDLRSSEIFLHCSALENW